MTKPRLTLIGAGPGDPDLITVKGMKALQDADVVLYDALVDESLLSYAPVNALKVFVGKRGGQEYLKQEAINDLIVKHALEGNHVVRLKGGDPFVFGRGHEELEYAYIFGIETTVIPGISSAIAVPELVNVPVTRRHFNESFWVLTGTTKSGDVSDDIKLAAQSSATAIILMGMKQLENIMLEFIKAGKSNTAVMVIQGGSTPEQNQAIARVTSIVEEVKKKNIQSPAIIVIGEVVELHPDFNYEYVVSNYQDVMYIN